MPAKKFAFSRRPPELGEDLPPAEDPAILFSNHDINLANLRLQNFDHSAATHGTLHIEGTELTRLNLSKTTFGSITLKDVRLSNCDLANLSTRGLNLTRVEFNVIANDATRVAALLSGEVDMVYTVPPQDMERINRTANLRIIQGPELRTIYLGMDQGRAELLKSDVRGRNPFQDVRVRRAVNHAIDIQAIVSRVMRGQARPTAQIFGPGVNGFLEANDTRPALDLDAARRLLTEAGYPNGFGVTLDCPNDRYVNDEAICTAVVSMLARIGIRVTLAAQTRARFFAEVNAPRYNTSLYMLGWTPNTYDAHNALFNLAGTRDGTRGVFNNGGYSSAAFDTLLDQIAVETVPARRQELITQATRLLQEDAAYVPLHQQQVVWASRTNVQLVQQADNGFPLRSVRMGN